MPKLNTENKYPEIYRRLYACYGPQHWWPAEDPFEVIVGAILTQSAAWTNVEKGILNLKKAGALSPRALRKLPHAELAHLIRPTGYYNAKAVKLKAFSEWFGRQFEDSLENMCAVDMEELREQLLEVHGIGEETADSILLYACKKPIFVIDAYTRRVIDCLGLKPETNKYGSYQAPFMDNLPHEAQIFNEYHALLVALGKSVCRKSVKSCSECCLKELCRCYPH
jgi:endonuclease-3 related protein